MDLIVKMTVRYDFREDRLKVAVTSDRGRSFSFWLTARLAQALVDGILKRWSQSQAIGGPTPSSLQAWEQDNALQKQQPSKPVKVKTASTQLVETVDIALRGERFYLTFRGSDNLAARMPLSVTEMRQWLHVVYGQFVKARWPLQVWPQWIRQGASMPTNQAQPTLH